MNWFLGKYLHETLGIFYNVHGAAFLEKGLGLFRVHSNYAIKRKLVLIKAALGDLVALLESRDFAV